MIQHFVDYASLQELDEMIITITETSDVNTVLGSRAHFS